MKELPILFSTPMVQAIQEDRKKMTRRTQGLETINLLPDEMKLYGEQHTVNSTNIQFIFKPVINMLNIGSILINPRYQKGDHIWIREQYYASGYWITDGLTKSGKKRKRFIDNTLNYDNRTYLYDDNKPEKFETSKEFKRGAWFKRTSLFMPKKAARIWLECTGVRCERLNDISEQDAKDEGIERVNNDYPPRYRNYTDDEGWLGYPTLSFFSLWRKINGKDSVRINPWVFIYEFKKIEIPCSGQ